MRRIWWALAGVVLVLGVGLGVAAYNVDAWIAASRERIAKQAALALGRDVSFGEVGISLRGGLSIRIADLVVGDDPAFSKDPFLRADALEARVRILPALRRRIEIDRIVLRSPEITVIRSAMGLSTASLGRGTAPGDAPAQEGAGTAAPGALAIALAGIEDGTVRFVDRRSRPAVESVATQLAVRSRDLSPGTPVRFEMEAAVLGAKRRNLRAEGQLELLADPTVDLSLELAPLDLAKALAFAGGGMEGLTGAGGLSLRAKGSAGDLVLAAKLDARDAELRAGSGFAKPRGRPLEIALSGRLRAGRLDLEKIDLVVGETRLAGKGSVESLAAPSARVRLASKELRPASFDAGNDADVLRDLALDARLAFPSTGTQVDAQLRSPSGSLRGVDYGDLALDARMDRGRLSVSKLALAGYGGRLEATGSADLRAPDGPGFDARIDVRGASVEKLLAARGASDPTPASGSLDLRISLRGAGASWEAIAPTLAGGGDLEVVDGVLHGVNPAGEALRALAGLPILSGRRLSQLLESHPQAFGAESTPFERIETRLEISGGELVARETQLRSRDYDIVAKGRYAIDGRLDSSAVLVFSSELSDALVTAEGKLRFLRSRAGRVELPVVIRGTPGEIEVDPDLAYVASSVSREAISDVVGRAVGGRRAPADADGGESGEARPPASVGDLGRDLLRRGLGGLLGSPPEE